MICPLCKKEIKFSYELPKTISDIGEAIHYPTRDNDILIQCPSCKESFKYFQEVYK